jgi:Transcription factor WhiB
MFDSYQQYRDWAALQKAIDDSPEIPTCTNDPELWFMVYGGISPEIRQACGSCLVRKQCASYGVKWETEGIWGGLTPSERDRLRASSAA